MIRGRLCVSDSNSPSHDVSPGCPRRLAVHVLDDGRLHGLPAFPLIPREHASHFVPGQVGDVHAPLHVERRTGRTVDTERASDADQGHAVQQEVLSIRRTIPPAADDGRGSS